MNTDNTRNATWKEWLLIVAGVVAILIGMAVNIWTAERLLTQDGDLSLAGDIIVWLFDIIAISIGFALIFYRKRVEHTSIFQRRHFQHQS